MQYSSTPAHVPPQVLAPKNVGGPVPLAILSALLLLAVGACTLLPVDGPVVSVAEASVGLVPCALALVAAHLIHVRRRARSGRRPRAWAVAVPLLLVGFGTFVGLASSSVAESERASARTSSRYPSSYSAANATMQARRRAKHFEEHAILGWGVVGFGVLLGGAGLLLAAPRK